MKYLAGFIGAGNMGGSLIEAACKSASPHEIALYDINQTVASNKAILTGAISTDIDDLVKNSKYVFLGVKPNVIKSVLSSIKDKITSDTIIVSMAAGVDIKTIATSIESERIIRIMPNTPVSVGKGTILFCVGDLVTNDDINGFKQILSEAGLIDYINESYIDAAAALSGCGPAYVYMFIEALADGAVKCGLPRDKAMIYAEQTVMGAAALAFDSDKHPGKLKDEVCSPGGTTIEGVLALEKENFRFAVSNAVVSAYEKTSKLKK